MLVPNNAKNWTPIWGKMSFPLLGGMTLAPMLTSTKQDQTSAGLCAITRTLIYPTTDFILSKEFTFTKQTRLGSAPNPWECFALAFNWRLRSNDEKEYGNIVWFKTNGIQLSVAFNEIDEKFLLDAPAFKTAVGSRNVFSLSKVGQRLALHYNGTQIFDKVFTGLYDAPGFVGPYCEDSNVKIHSTQLEILK